MVDMGVERMDDKCVVCLNTQLWHLFHVAGCGACVLWSCVRCELALCACACRSGSLLIGLLVVALASDFCCLHAAVSAPLTVPHNAHASMTDYPILTGASCDSWCHAQ
jgi:hypothetical protein